jgi:hypothetical protein
MKMKDSCHQKKEQPKKSGSCDKNNCNPFMACASGNFYTLEKNYIESHSVFTWGEKVTPENDNRLAKCLCDCWHPPENI